MKNIFIFVFSIFLATSTQAQEPATYDGSILDIPLVEVNSQHFSDVKVLLNGDGTWELQGVGGSGSQLLGPSSNVLLEVLTRDSDSNFGFQAIARVTEGIGACTSLTILPQQTAGNIITIRIVSTEKILGPNEACPQPLILKRIDIELDTDALSPGTYIVKYRDKSGEFILP